MRSSLLLPYREFNRFTARIVAAHRWGVTIDRVRAMVVWIDGEPRWRVEPASRSSRVRDREGPPRGFHPTSESSGGNR